MSGVEAPELIDTPAQMPATSATPDMAANEAAIDAALSSVWDKSMTNGADRGDDGKFTGNANGEGEANADPAQAQTGDHNSLEGEGGEEGDPGSTPADGIPLPAFLKGKTDLWDAVAPEKRAEMATHLQDLNVRMSKMGQDNARYQPLMEVAQEFSDYWSNVVDQNGEPLPPAEGVRYLANIQRAMDQAPLETLLQIADTYNLRPQLAKAFGGQVQAVPADQQALLNEIAGLKQALNQRQPVAADIDAAIEKRELRSTLQTFADSKPHWNHVAGDMPFFIEKAKTQLGGGAGRTAVLDRAYDLAVQADPALRQLAAAAKAPDKAGQRQKAEGARRATSVNAPSSIPGKAREQSLDDELGAVWDSHAS